MTQRSLLCSFYGCNRRWTTNTDRRRCAEHQARKTAAHPPKPATPPVRPFCEPVEREEA